LLLSIASFALDLTNLTRDLLGHSAKEEDKNKNKKVIFNTKIRAPFREKWL
jgi:hypothetical protein